MRQTTTYLLFLAVLCLSSCRAYISTHGQRESLVLRTVETPEGEVTYSLYSSGSSSPKIHRTRMVRTEKPRLGIVARSIGIEAAESRGLDPWQGVLLDRVSVGGPAAKAGLRRGDVLLSLRETELSSREQLEDLLELELRPHEAVSAEVLRLGGDDGPETFSVEIVPDSATEENRVTDPYDLSTSRLVRFLTGMQVGGVTAELAEDIFDDHRPRVMVGNVQTGSPAYFAGLRMGDRVVTCDGSPVSSVSDLHGAIAARARNKGLRLQGLEEPDLGGEPLYPDGDDLGDRGPIVLEVEGLLGAHRAEIVLSDDLDKVTSFNIPILLEYRSDVRRKRVSFLDFIFQFGFNYRRAYQPSDTRQSEKSSYFSLLPFGMFEFESSPSHRRQTYFWFITLKSKR